MAKHGEHPELPSELEQLLDSDVHTIFLKADCPPRVKRGTIGQLKLIELEGGDDEMGQPPSGILTGNIANGC